MQAKRKGYSEQPFENWRDRWYCAIDVSLNAPTICVLLHYTARGLGWEYDDRAKVKRQIAERRYDVQGVLRLSPEMPHYEQAERIAATWTEHNPSFAINSQHIGGSAVATFRSNGIRSPRYFNDKSRTPEQLRSEMIRVLNAGELRFADGLAMQMGTMDCEQPGDARAVAIAIWASRQTVTSIELHKVLG